MYEFCFYFLLFFLFSVIGWVIECISCSLWYHKLIFNRGFLIGPYCPVYGLGALYMYTFLGKYSNDALVLFVMAVLGTSIIVYLTSLYMEKVFKARWWDYSKDAFNLNGRVCLRNSLAFGVLGLGFVYYVKPFYDNIMSGINHNYVIVVTIIFMIIFLLDCIVSYVIMSKLKNKIFDLKHDSTDEIDKEVKEILSDYAYYVKKTFRSFPDLSFNLPSGEEIVSSIMKALNNFDPKNHK